MMNTRLNTLRSAEWFRNDSVQIGTDFSSPLEVAGYDARMRQMRDVDGEVELILSLLNLSENSRLLELGSGTGAFTRAAARRCGEVVSVDISPAMLNFSEERARAEGLGNISFQLGSFLSYNYPEERFDAAVTSMALHHLPDVWKEIALENIRAALKPGGDFFLLDAVFDWGDRHYGDYFSGIVEREKSSRLNMARHIATEFSTLTWIMEGLLKQAGFSLKKSIRIKDFIYGYYCVKTA